MSSLGCLTRDQVAAYLLGNLTEIEMDETARHLADCAQCQAVADELESLEDGLIGALRGSNEAERFLDEPEFEEARLRAAAAWAPAAADQGCPLDGAQLPGRHGPPPERLGQYQLLDVIGKGGMGAVYRALHPVLDRIVALKILSPEQTKDTRAVARFEREIKAIGKLDHANIVRPVDAGADGEVHYLVMDFVEGHDLGSVVRKLGPLAVTDACELVRQAAVGLQYVYERNMVHRDIKPPNLILDKQGVVKLLDLGLSLLSEQPPEDGTLTSNGILMGTCDYIAPEQCEDSHNVDIRADIYSLGCTLYQLLCGHVPFPGPRYDKRMKKVMAHMHDPVPPIQDLRDDVPEPLADVLDRLLTKSPEDRYQSPAELVSALEPLAAGSDLEDLLRRVDSSPEAEADTARSAVDTPIHVSSAPVDTQPSEQPAPAHTATQPTRRRWKPITIGATLAALLLLGVIITITNRNGTIVIETMDPNVRVSVTRNGEEVAVADARNGWTIRLRSGEYDLNVKGSPDRFKVDRDSVTVTRGDEVRVQVTRRRTKVTDEPTLAIAPFDETEAKQYQQTWAQYLDVPLQMTNSIGMKLILIPPGEFLMGSTEEEVEKATTAALRQMEQGQTTPDRSGGGVHMMQMEIPEHRVRIANSFYAGVHEVTVGQFGQFVEATGYETYAEKRPEGGPGLDVTSGKLSEKPEYSWRNPGFAQTENDPVVMVSWGDAQRFGEWLGQQEGKKYRLLTEAEWEYCCRAGTTTPWHSGDGEGALRGAGNVRDMSLKEMIPDMEVAISWNDGFPFTAPVGTFRSNAFGLFDMHGNVSEWCEDWFEEEAYKRYAAGDFTPPSPVDPRANRVVRGGSFFYGITSQQYRSAYRSRRGPEYGVSYNIGFRVVCEVARRQVSEATSRSPTTKERTDAGDAATPPIVAELGSSDAPPLSEEALVTRPTRIDGVKSWTIEPRVPRGLILDGAFSPSNELLCASTSEGLVYLWNTLSGKLDRILNGDGDESGRKAFYMARCVDWSPDGGLLAVRRQFDGVQIWDLHSPSAKIVHTLPTDDVEYGKSIAFSPDGQVLAVGLPNGQIALWNVAQGELRETVRGHTQAQMVAAVAWAPDGKTLASGSWDGSVALWDADALRLRHKLATIPEGKWVTALAFSPDGKTLAVAAGDNDWWTKVCLVDVESGELRTELPGPGAVHNTLVWSPDGGKIISGGWQSGKSRVWDLTADAALREDFMRDVAAIDVSHDGKAAAVLGWFGEVQLWEPASSLYESSHRKPARMLSHFNATVAGPAFSRNGTTWASHGDTGAIQVWETESGRLVARLEGTNRGAEGFAAPSSDGALVAAPLGKGVNQWSDIGIWGVDNEQLVKTLRCVSKPLHVAWSPDDRTLAVSDANVELWDVSSGQSLRSIPVNGPCCLAWSPDGASLAVGQRGQIHLFDPSTGTTRKSLTNTTVKVQVLAWSSDGSFLAAGDGKHVAIFDVASGQLNRSFECEADVGLCWFDNDKKIAAAGSDKVTARDATTGATIWRERAHLYPKAVSPDGRFAVTVAHNAIRLRRLADGQITRSGYYFSSRGQYVAISPNGYYRGSPGIDKELLYVVQTDEGQETLSPDEFSKRFGWKNDPP